MHQASFAGASMAGVSNKKATVKILVVLQPTFCDYERHTAFI